MNFTYDVRQPPDKSYGVIKENGSWSGIIGMLQRKEIDIGLVAFIISYERSLVASFPFGFGTSKQTFFIKTPMDSFNWLAYIVPFHWFVWLAVLIMVILASLFLYFILR